MTAPRISDKRHGFSDPGSITQASHNEEQGCRRHIGGTNGLDESSEVGFDKEYRLELATCRSPNSLAASAGPSVSMRLVAVFNEHATVAGCPNDHQRDSNRFRRQNGPT